MTISLRSPCPRLRRAQRFASAASRSRCTCSGDATTATARTPSIKIGARRRARTSLHWADTTPKAVTLGDQCRSSDAAFVRGPAPRQSGSRSRGLEAVGSRRLERCCGKTRHGWAQYLGSDSYRARPPGRESGTTSSATMTVTRSRSRCSYLIWAQDGGAGLFVSRVVRCRVRLLGAG